MLRRRSILSAAVAAFALAVVRPSRAGTKPVTEARPTYSNAARTLLASSALVWIVRYPQCQPAATHDIYDTVHPVVFVPVPMPTGNMTIEAVRGPGEVDYLAGVLDLPGVSTSIPGPIKPSVAEHWYC